MPTLHLSLVPLNCGTLGPVPARSLLFLVPFSEPLMRHLSLIAQVWVDTKNWDNMVEEVAETEGPPAHVASGPARGMGAKKAEGSGRDALAGGGVGAALGDSTVKAGVLSVGGGGGGAVGVGQKRPATGTPGANAAGGRGVGAPVSKKVAKLKKGLGMK